MDRFKVGGAQMFFVFILLVHAIGGIDEHQNNPISTLSNGEKLPLVGLGCSHGLRREHVKSALLVGYRHLDTAQAYRWGYHEHEVGEAITDSEVPRETIFLQTKIDPEDLGYEATKRSFAKSLERLQTTYVDSILIHKPRCWVGACNKEPEGTWEDSWRALEELYEGGKARAIGICDVDDRLLNELLRKKHKPHVIQNWMDPFHQDKAIRKRCKELGIQYQAYSTLGTQWMMQGHQTSPVFGNSILKAIAERHQRSIAQVVLNWAVRHDVAVLPSSKNNARQKSNLACCDFELTVQEIASIDALDGKAKAEKPDPNLVEMTFENKSPEPLEVFWISPGDEEIKTGSLQARGGKLSTNTYHSHRFRFRSVSGKPVKELVINKGRGAKQLHVVAEPNEIWPEL